MPRRPNALVDPLAFINANGKYVLSSNRPFRYRFHRDSGSAGGDLWTDVHQWSGCDAQLAEYHDFGRPRAEIAQPAESSHDDLSKVVKRGGQAGWVPSSIGEAQPLRQRRKTRVRPQLLPAEIAV